MVSEEYPPADAALLPGLTDRRGARGLKYFAPVTQARGTSHLRCSRRTISFPASTLEQERALQRTMSDVDGMDGGSSDEGSGPCAPPQVWPQAGVKKATLVNLLRLPALAQGITSAFATGRSAATALCGEDVYALLLATSVRREAANRVPPNVTGTDLHDHPCVRARPPSCRST